MGRTFKYYPSSPFSPSVALGALLTRNLGLALGMVFFETTETKETTAKQSIIRMIINFSVVSAVPVVSVVSVVSALTLIAKFTFQFSPFTLTEMAARWIAIVFSIAPFR